MLPLVDSFHDSLRAIIRVGWHGGSLIISSTAFATLCVPYCSAKGSRHRSLLHTSTTFTTVCAPYYSSDCSADCLFFGFAFCIARRMTRQIAHSFVDGFRYTMREVLRGGRRNGSLFLSSPALPKLCVLYCSADDKSSCSWVHSCLLLVDDFSNVARAVDGSPDCSSSR